MWSGSLVSRRLLHTYTEMPDPGGGFEEVWAEMRFIRCWPADVEVRLSRSGGTRRENTLMFQSAAVTEWKSNSSLIRPAGIDVLPHIREGVVRPFVRIDKSYSDCVWFWSSECSRMISRPFLFCNTSVLDFSTVWHWGWNTSGEIWQINSQWWKKMIAVKERASILVAFLIFQGKKRVFFFPRNYKVVSVVVYGSELYYWSSRLIERASPSVAWTTLGSC